MDDGVVIEVAAAARAQGREALLESEGLRVAAQLGLRVPRCVFVPEGARVADMDLSSVPGERLVLKVVSAQILHKSDVGGVAVVARSGEAIEAALLEMSLRLGDRPRIGYSLNQLVPHDKGFGSELLLGLRFTSDFGPVVTLGLGGVHAERLARSLGSDAVTAILSPEMGGTSRRRAALRGKAWAPILTEGSRGLLPLVSEDRLGEILDRTLALAARCCPDPLLEFEVNPLVLTPEGPFALDALGRLGGPLPPRAAPRPLAKVGRLLRPESVALIGVSSSLNPGHVILNNLIREGFPKERIRVVKPGTRSVEGCACVATIGELPEPVDLMVLSVDAAQVPTIVSQVIEHQAAESLIVIPGGLGERPGTEGLEEQVRSRLEGVRHSPWRGPVMNGGNCLGIRSRPGRYDTMFIPEHKLEPARGPVSPLALVSQSGAFAVAAASKLAGLNPRYLISVGNQTDLTVGDYLAHLKDDAEVEVFVCYVEAFRPLDGLAWLRAASEVVTRGKSVLLYRAGRTPAGAQAAASHTAAVAGDYSVTKELAEASGVVVVDSLEDLVDLARLFCLLRGKPVAGGGLGALSNAGFECVSYADNLGPLRMAELEVATIGRLEDLLRARRIDGIVSARNPLDVTPMMDDAGFAEAAKVILEDPAVDVGIVGCVPLTGALRTLPRSASHEEDLDAPASVVSRLVDIARVVPKPWVAVVDAGSAYDPMVARLEAGGVPTFRSAGRALRLLGRYCATRLPART
jgi:acyl-CoA synthetase (NDP forming)